MEETMMWRMGVLDGTQWFWMGHNGVGRAGSVRLVIDFIDLGQNLSKTLATRHRPRGDRIVDDHVELNLAGKALCVC